MVVSVVHKNRKTKKYSHKFYQETKQNSTNHQNIMSSNSSVATSSTASLSTEATNNNNTIHNKKTIFLGIAPATTVSQLFGYLIDQDKSYTKTIRDIRIPTDKEGNSRCFAFITFHWHEDAVKAMEDLEGRPLDGLILHPRWATQTSKNHKRNGKKNSHHKRRHNRRQQQNNQKSNKGQKVSKT